MRVLVRKFGSPEAVLTAPYRRLVETPGIDRKTARSILDPALRTSGFVEDQMKQMERYRVRLLTFLEPSYPVNLDHIPDPPAYLFVRGDLVDRDRYAVAIVGTREPTPYGRRMAENLAGELSARGITVVSGLARGIDTCAHTAALEAGGRTVAILGCGVDRVYPPENFKLAMQIVELGAMLSDYPMRTGPESVNFPGRNRIISGLSLGTVIVEAGEKSGALLTAEYALEQNRELFAVPGTVTTPQAIGPNRLIKQGAKLVESVEDILVELESRLEHALKPAPARAAWNLNGVEQVVYDTLGSEPLHVDVISRSASMTVPETLAHLLRLELMGAVRQVAGKHFIRA
jgi:DNA processing protein